MNKIILLLISIALIYWLTKKKNSIERDTSEDFIEGMTDISDDNNQDDDIDEINNDSDEINNDLDEVNNDSDEVSNADSSSDETKTEEIHSFFNMESEDDIETNDNVFLDVTTQGNTGRIIINLKSNVVPTTCTNFKTLCEQGAYNNTSFHRVIKNFMIQGGDMINGDGTGSKSIYGDNFDDENFILNNNKGTISMANSGPNTNGCQFFINTKDNNFLDNKHVVFGEVVKGMDLIEWIENIETDEHDRPKDLPVITRNGIL